MSKSRVNITVDPKFWERFKKFAKSHRLSASSCLDLYLTSIMDRMEGVYTDQSIIEHVESGLLIYRAKIEAGCGKSRRGNKK